MRLIAMILIYLFMSACSMERMERAFGPPTPADETYQKAGASKIEINKALTECNKKYPDNRNKTLAERNNIMFKSLFCMEDKGFHSKDGISVMKSCKNFTNPKLPICVARGAYN